MKKLLIIIFMIVSIISSAQLIPTISGKVQGTTTSFGANYAQGTFILNIANGDLYQVTNPAGVLSTASISTSSADLELINPDELQSLSLSGNIIALTDGGTVDISTSTAVTNNTAKNTYPSTDATKLAGIEAGANVNVNADWNSGGGDSEILNKPSLNSMIDWTAASQGVIHATNYVDNDNQLSDAEIAALGYIKTFTETDPVYLTDSSYIKTHVRADLDTDPTNEIQDISGIATNTQAIKDTASAIRSDMGSGSLWAETANGLTYKTATNKGNIGIGIDANNDYSVYVNRDSAGWVAAFINADGTSNDQTGVKIHTYRTTNALDVYGQTYLQTLYNGTATSFVGIDAYNKLVRTTVTLTGDMEKATYDPANIGEQLVGLATTQSLTNKTINGVTLTTGGSSTSFLNGNGSYTVPTGLWTESTYGAYYSDNIGIGSVASNSYALSVNKSLASLYASLIWNSSTTGHGLIFGANNNSNSYYALRGANSSEYIFGVTTSGIIEVDKYGSGNITGTATYNLSVDANGKLIETANPAGTYSLTVEEQDGTPSVSGVTKIKVTDGTLSDNGSGVVSITTGGGSSGGAPDNADYLVGTANTTLTNEIVVGTTPNGDLGGTWSNISVDNDSHTHTSSTISGLNVTSDASSTGAWKILYSNGSNVWTELAIGASGTMLRSTGTASAPDWATPAGGGNVSTSGSPVANDYARFVNGTDIEGRSSAEMKADLGYVTASNISTTGYKLANWTATTNNLSDGFSVYTDVRASGTADGNGVVTEQGIRDAITAAGTPNNPTITLQGTAVASSPQTFTLNQSADQTITIDAGAGTAQDLSLSGNVISLTSSTATVDISASTDVTANTAFRTTPSSVITAGDNLSWTGNTLNAVGGSGSTDLSLGTITSTTLDINSSSGNNVTLPSATGTVAGILTSIDWGKIQTNTTKVSNVTHTGEVTGATALTIANNVIEAVNLESTNTPTDNYLPSYDAATGGFSWVEPSASSGTVTSVGISGSDFTITGSPVTTSGTIAMSIANGVIGSNELSGDAIDGQPPLGTDAIELTDLFLYYDDSNSSLGQFSTEELSDFLEDDLVPSNMITAGTDLEWSGTTLSVSPTVQTFTSKTSSFTIDCDNGYKSTVGLGTLTADITITIDACKDGKEGSIEITRSSTAYTVLIAGGTGYTTEVKMGNKSAIDNSTATAHTTVIYWRMGSTLYYGFLYDN